MATPNWTDTRRDAGRDQMTEPLKQSSLLQLSTLVYGVMTLLGLLIMHFAHDNLGSSLTMQLPLIEWGRFACIGALGAGLLLISSYFFEDWFPTFRQLKTTMTKLLGPASIPMAIYLATVSAIGEEVLFRGAIQPYLGLAFTSLLFGLAHLDQAGKASAWSLWAILAGALMGWTFLETGSLWPAILIHFVVNLISILRIRQTYRQLLVTLAEDKSEG